MAAPPDGSQDSNGADFRWHGQDSLRRAVREAKQRVESQLIMEALEKHRWNRRLAAEALQISYRSLMYKMKAWNLRAGAAWQPSKD